MQRFQIDYFQQTTRVANDIRLLHGVSFKRYGVALDAQHFRQDLLRQGKLGIVGHLAKAQ